MGFVTSKSELLFITDSDHLQKDWLFWAGYLLYHTFISPTVHLLKEISGKPGKIYYD